MTATKKPFLTMLGAAGLVMFSSASLANDANGERDASIYDQNPDCMNRGQVQQGQPAPCELPVAGSTRRPRAPLGSNVAPAGSAAGAGTATTGVGGVTVGASAAAAQTSNRLRSTR
ncbi:MAG: hypothetical protein JWN73_3800 [Betaproteobacteria bacterium]|nr:hypothetical protein [Betaproteobacteria bacterium]